MMHVYRAPVMAPEFPCVIFKPGFSTADATEWTIEGYRFREDDPTKEMIQFSGNMWESEQEAYAMSCSLWQWWFT